MSEPQKKAEQPQATVTIVTNNQERLETIHIPPAKENLPAVPGAGDLLVLLPGVNLVNTEALKSCRTNKVFDAKFSTRIPRHVAIEARSEREGKPMLTQGKEVTARAPLAKLTNEEAIEVVNDTNTVEQLKAFKSEESRDEIRTAISNRIELIEKGVSDSEAA